MVAVSERFDPWQGTRLHGFYYFVGTFDDVYTLFRQREGDEVLEPIGSFGPGFDPIEVFIEILEDRRQIAERERR